jgi:hypothetical protein
MDAFNIEDIKYNSHILKADMKFGKLTTVRRASTYSRFATSDWICTCDCGQRVKARRLDLLSGKKTECYYCRRNTSVQNILNTSSFVDIEELRNQ